MQKKPIKNQLIWVERSEPTRGEPILTVADEYKNVIAQVKRTYDKETKRFGFAVYDHKGELMFTENNRGRIKQALLKDKDRLLNEAHERRLAKTKSRNEHTQGDSKGKPDPGQADAAKPSREEELRQTRQPKAPEPDMKPGEPAIEY